MQIPDGIDGQLVMKLRKQKNWTMRGLAAVTRLSPATISRIEAGRLRDPQGSTYYRIAKALDVSVEALMRT